MSFINTNPNINIQTVADEANEVKMVSDYTSRYTFVRDSVNAGTAGQFVFGVSDKYGNNERRVVINAENSTDLLKAIEAMLAGESLGGSTTRNVGNNVFVKLAQPKIAAVSYQSPHSGRVFRVKYSAQKPNHFVFTVTGTCGEPEQSHVVSREKAEQFIDYSIEMVTA
jgi:hypothetical protein